MHKIQTIFKRDPNNNFKITREYIYEGIDQLKLEAIEKVDGTNVRLTVRSHTLMRLEKRRSPSKFENKKGIIEPWYVDASESDSQDKYIWDAAKNTDISRTEDGEWSGEAVGPKIQGNPLNLEDHRVILFSHKESRRELVMYDVPVTYDGLKEWLPKQKSNVGNDCFIEGIIWYYSETSRYKIKAKDFV